MSRRRDSRSARAVSLQQALPRPPRIGSLRAWHLLRANGNRSATGRTPTSVANEKWRWRSLRRQDKSATPQNYCDAADAGLPRRLTADLESPPNGKLLRVRCPDGDTLQVVFEEVDSEELLLTQYGDTALPRLIPSHPGEFEYPLLIPVITMRIGGYLELGKRASRIDGMTMTGRVAASRRIGLQLG